MDRTIENFLEEKGAWMRRITGKKEFLRMKDRGLIKQIYIDLRLKKIATDTCCYEIAMSQLGYFLTCEYFFTLHVHTTYYYTSHNYI